MTAAALAGRDRLEQILGLARWAPSGDNEQCWRFEIVSDQHVVVHGYDTRDHCVYDLDGSASQIGIGALIETMAIAASQFGLRIDASRIAEAPVERPLIDIHLVADPQVVSDPLAAHIETRTVHRRALSSRPLTAAEKTALEASIGEGYDLVWRATAAERRHMARLLFESAKLRLTIPEAYLVHRGAIAWGARSSNDRVPEAAVGLDPMTAILMRWVMRSWTRVRFFNRFLAGTWIPRIQLDVIPALRCAAHFVLAARRAPATIDDFIAAGRAVQRFWLTAAQLGLQLQPEMTPLIFSRYGRNRLPFSSLPGAQASAQRIALRLDQTVGESAARSAVFMGRLGAGRPASSRSLRLPLEQLMYEPGVPVGDQKLRRTSM